MVSFWLPAVVLNCENWLFSFGSIKTTSRQIEHFHFYFMVFRFQIAALNSNKVNSISLVPKSDFFVKIQEKIRSQNFDFCWKIAHFFFQQLQWNFLIKKSKLEIHRIISVFFMSLHLWQYVNHTNGTTGLTSVIPLKPY